MQTNTADRDKPVIFACGVDAAAEDNHHEIAGALLKSRRARIMNVRDLSINNVSDIRLLVPNAKALLVHMSSAITIFDDRTELNWIKFAEEFNLPIFSVADTHFSWARPPAKGLVKNVRIFVASPDEVVEACHFGYLSAEYIGGPPMWGRFHIEKTVRSKRQLFLVGGVKSPRVTNEMLKVVVDGLKQAYGYDFSLIFRPHPKEDAADDAKLTWDGVTSFDRNEILSGVKLEHASDAGEIVDIARAKASFFTSGASGTIIAGINRLPTAYYLSDTIDRRMLMQIGRKDWTPVVKGATHVFRTPEDVLSFVTNGDPKQKMAQKKVYPNSAGFKSADKIADEILAFIGR